MEPQTPHETPPPEPSKSAPSTRRRARTRLVVWAVLLAALSLGGAVGVKTYLKNRDDSPAGAGQTQAGHDHGQSEIKYWTCSMHPEIRQSGPGKCPICGMDLTPITKDSDGESGADGGTFTISAERRQLIGVKTVEIHPEALVKTIRAVGVVAPDETKIVEVRTKFEGYVDRVFADQTWKYVKRGEPLFTVYSPELTAAREEYLLAKRSATVFNQTAFGDARPGDAMLAAARRRLALWDVTDEQIAALEQTGHVERTVTIHAPASGYLITKDVFPNTAIKPDMKLYTIADFGTVWVNADVYENDLASVKLGQVASMTLPSHPGRTFSGKVTFLRPQLDPQTRSLKVRLEFPNPDLTLKPEMYADVEISVPLGKRLTVPESAVIRTGKHDIVFVALDEGRFAVRHVELGLKIDGRLEILDGLSAGEKIVETANFLVGAESKLQGVGSSWSGGEHRH